AGDGIRKPAQRQTLDLYHVRSEIDNLLRELRRPIVVFMDDIDKMTAQEVGQLFLMMRAVADFPMTVYLLAFDHDAVRKALTSTLGSDGAAHLKRIVQLQMDIPPASAMQLENMLASQLDRLLVGISVTEAAKKEFTDLFHSCLKEFLPTPKSIKQLTNLLGALLPTIRREIYWPDFVAIVSLMVFAPEAYRIIRDSGAHFTGMGQWSAEDRKDAKRFH